MTLSSISNYRAAFQQIFGGFITFLVSLCSLLFLYNIPAHAQSKLTAFIPEFKINPVSGYHVGGNNETVETLREQYNLIDKNQEILLSGFPGETLAFQLITPADPTLTIQLENALDWNYGLFQVGVVKIPKSKDHSFPDILMPLPKKEGNFTTVKDRDLIPHQSAYYDFWIEFTLTETGQNQVIRFSLEVNGQTFRENLSVVVKVYGFPLKKPQIAIDFNEYGDKYLHILSGHPSEKEIAKVEEKTFGMMHKHGGDINPLPYKSQSGLPRSGMTPALINNDLLNPQLDWSKFDKRFGKFFDGSGFNDQQPLHHFYLPFNPNWPAPFEMYYNDREKYEQIWTAFAKKFIKHFSEKAWTKTIFQVYCNQKPSEKNQIPWNLDEPKGFEDYQALRYYNDLTKKAFAETGPVKIVFRIDISHFYCDKHIGSQNKDLRVNGGDKILEPIDVWVISRHSLYDEYAIVKAKELMAKGKEVWIYAETPKIKEAGFEAVRRIYNAWNNGYTGLFIWRSSARKMNKNKGSKFIYYALKAGGKKDIFPSIRLKLLKRGLDDTRIFDSAIEKHKTTKTQIVSLWNKYLSGDLKEIWQYRTTLTQLLFEI